MQFACVILAKKKISIALATFFIYGAASVTCNKIFQNTHYYLILVVISKISKNEFIAK